MKEEIVGLKELRENMAKYAAQVQTGRSIIVIKRSKPIFKLTPVDDDGIGWETVINFDEIHRGGVPAKELLAALKRLDKGNGQARKVSKQTQGS